MNNQSSILLSEIDKNDLYRFRTYDFFKGIAILGVIMVHTIAYFPTNIAILNFIIGLGRFGVQIFFCISAITMCHMWNKRSHENNKIIKFYIRRFFRIVPLFWVATAIYLFIDGLGSGYFRPEGVGKVQIYLTIFLLHGFWPNTINSIVPGGWSIADEVIFYAIFPFLVLLLSKKYFQYILLAIVAFFTYHIILSNLITNFLNYFYITESKTIVRDYLNLNFLNQFPIFLLGCSLYYLQSNLGKRLLITSLCIVFWVAASFALINYIGLNIFIFQIICICIFIAIYFGLYFGINCRPLELLGKNSYSIYIFHFLILKILFTIFGSYALIRPSVYVFLIFFILATYLSYIISKITYVLFEKRMINIGKTLTKNKVINYVL